jgi:surface antigen
MLPQDDRSREGAVPAGKEQEQRSIQPLVRLPARNDPLSSRATALLPEQKTEQVHPAGEQPWLFPPAQEPEALHASSQQPDVSTRALPDPASPSATRVLLGVAPDPLETSTKRMPVVIKATLKKPAPLPPRPPHQKHRLLVNLFGLCMLVLILAMTFLSVTPLGRDLGWTFNPLQFGGNLINRPNNEPNNLVAQATATAVYHHLNDGYDPYYNAGQVISNGATSLDWPVGQCTYWANYEYHLLSGYWVPWSGNADQWVAGAARAGWNISRSPHVPSIIVLMPYIQMASSYGHVAVVIRIINSTTVQTSNMNWYAGNGGFDKVSYVNFTVGVGVYFIWHP